MEQLVLTDAVQDRSYLLYRRFTSKGSPCGFEVRESGMALRFFSYLDSMRFLDLVQFGTCFGRHDFDASLGSFRIKDGRERIPTCSGVITIIGESA